MNILFIGDIFGSPGRQAVKNLLPKLVDAKQIDFVVANVDNAAGGKGATPDVIDELMESGVHCFTSGNHIWEKESIMPYLDRKPIVRPYNVAQPERGRGFHVLPVNNSDGLSVAVVHLQGEVFMKDKGRKMVNPFGVILELLEAIRQTTPVILVDIHAEATAEKRALGWLIDGKASALVGTHTHIQTADEQILPQGMAYITDLGMTGPHDSVIGLDVAIALKRFSSKPGECKEFKVAKEGVRLEGVFLRVDPSSGKTLLIERIREVL